MMQTEAEATAEEEEAAQGSSVDRDEAEQLVKYAGKALRGRKFGIFEQLLCQSLVQATVTVDPLRKIQLVCEAALMLEPDKQKALDIDLARVDILRVVNEAFSSRVEETGKDNYCLVDVRFGFEESEENYNRFVKPWLESERLIHYPNRLAHLYSKLGVSYRRFYCIHCRSFLQDDFHSEKPGVKNGRCASCGSRIEDASYSHGPSYFTRVSFKFHDVTPVWEQEFALFHTLAKAGYNNLRASFLRWSMPFIMNLTRRLTEAVRPEVYQQIAELFVKARREEKAAINT